MRTSIFRARARGHASIATLALLAGCSAASDFDYSFLARDGGKDAETLDAAPDLDAVMPVDDAEASVDQDTALPDANAPDGSCANCCELAEVNERTCEGGRDEDCDGKTDCADSDCRQAPTCCPTPTFESGEVACTDTLDNDCDGIVDCDELGCKGVYECMCVKTVAEEGAFPAQCMDGTDNDCDRLIDCDETVACATVAGCCTKTSPSTFTESGAECSDGINNDCDADGIDCADPDCRMSSDAGMVASEVGLCGDGVDNDCDGQKDCVDSDCRVALVCCIDTPGQESVETACSDGVNNDCDADGADCYDSDCALDPQCCRPVLGGESTTLLCGNAKDDDCDGKVDCADPQCSGVRACCIDYLRANGQFLEKTETSCSDKYDNDCDGDVNCKDGDCFGSRECGIIIIDPPIFTTQ